MASLNQVQLIGHLGRDPEVRYLPSGQAVASVSLATSSKYKDRQGNVVEDTQWHRITFYDKLAEIAGEYLQKGSLVFVQGRLKYGKYTDKDGVEKNSADIVAGQMTMLGGKDAQGAGQERGGSRAQDRRQDHHDAPTAARQRPAPSRGGSTGFDDMGDDIPFLLNMNTVSDTAGLSKAKNRIKHGPKALHILRVNQGSF
jgi:single-strand DNA-binding protein